VKFLGKCSVNNIMSFLLLPVSKDMLCQYISIDFELFRLDDFKVAFGGFSVAFCDFQRLYTYTIYKLPLN
jgi:hypothetical protein